MKTNRKKLLFSSIIFCLFILALAFSATAAERTLTAEEMEKLAAGGELDAEKAARPEKLPDLTKGDKIPVNPKTGEITWNLGPTGIIGIKNDGFKGDQVLVKVVLPGSPAEGKIQRGDVIIGANGKNFVAGGHMGYLLGNEIIESEKAKNKGLLKLNIWRDRNFLKRNTAKDVKGIDIEELFKKAEEDGDIYDWKEENQQKKAVENAGFDEFPIDGFYTSVTLQLKVMGTYSENSPWDCPVTEKIRQDACKVVAERFKPDKRGRIRAQWLDAIALIASGKPEYKKLVHDWVRKQKLCRDMNADVPFNNRGMVSWHMGFNPLEMAIYYDATGDDYVLPELRYRAIQTALGQNGGGSWGHRFASPNFNGGKLHMRNPGYGAMNNAGGRCFFLLTLAKKAGIEHPEIDLAIERASRFFRTYVDKGVVPYGFHPPAATDDSNGKNYGVGYAFKVMGKLYEAKYYAQHSTHASFSRRGGHGSPTLWYYTPNAARITGPKGVITTMRNMRWFFTLSRRHDGSFVFQGEQAGIGGKPSRSPSATHLLYYSAPLEKTVITGKDPVKSLWFNDEDFEQLMISARGQIIDPELLKQIGKPIPERDTDYLIKSLNHFFPKVRSSIAKQLGDRYSTGEKKIVSKLVKLLSSDQPRYRGGACSALQACGTDVVLSYLSKITPLLKDDAEFVRVEALRAIVKATGTSGKQTQRLLLEAAADDYEGMTMDHGNVRNVVKGALFPRRGEKTKLLTDPFNCGFDDDLVEKALSSTIMMDPGGRVSTNWSRDTLIRLAGPITFVADEMQLNDAMFGFARTDQGRKLLDKFGYREAVEGDATNLVKRTQLDRELRSQVTFKLDNVTAKMVGKYKGAYRDMLDPMKLWLLDNPLAFVTEKRGKGVPPIITQVDDLIRIVENDRNARPLPSIYTDVKRMFDLILANAGNSSTRIDLCRAELKDTSSKKFFRQMAAMDQLVEMLGKDAIDDLGPYLGHEQWRLRKHSRKLAVKLAADPDAAGRLATLLDKYDGQTAAGILKVLADTKSSAGIRAAKMALRHKNATARAQAIQTIFALGGDAQLRMVLSIMQQATELEILRGCEKALLSRRKDSTHARRVSSSVIEMLPKSGPDLRRSIYWILAQLGGDDNIETLVKAADTEDEAVFKEIVMAMSYSPDRLADKAMLTLAKTSSEHAPIVAEQTMRRMVVGPDDIDKVPDDLKMDLASPMLKLDRNPKLITYLGKVHTGRSINALMRCMRLGPADISAQAIISAAERMENAPAAERKIAADGLQNVIEYIEVTQLRGGIEGKDWRTYPMWKALQARAGKAMLKVHKPEKAPIPEFDDLELDF